MMLGCKLNVSKSIKLLGEMRVKSPDDWADDSNHLISSLPLLLFDRLLSPVREIAASSLFERGKAATTLTTRFFSFSPVMSAVAA